MSDLTQAVPGRSQKKSRGAHLSATTANCTACSSGNYRHCRLTNWVSISDVCSVTCTCSSTYRH